MTPTLKALIEQINDAKMPSPYYFEDQEFFPEDAEKIDDIGPDEHRWYTISTKVWKLGNEFFGIRGPTLLKSEAMGYEDVCAYVETEAFEMEEVSTVTYKRKRQAPVLIA